MYVSSCYCMCPHTAIYVSAYCYVCVLMLLYVSAYCYICVRIVVSLCYCMRPHTAIYVSAYCYVCVLMLLYVSSCCCMCPHTAIYVSSLAANMPGHIYSSMRTHSAKHVSLYYSYYYRSSVFSFTTLSTATKWRRSHPRTMPKTTRLKVRCSHTIYVSSSTIYVSSYYYVCILILVHMCAHTGIGLKTAVP
jgi:hypothetical protein